MTSELIRVGCMPLSCRPRRVMRLWYKPSMPKPPVNFDPLFTRCEVCRQIDCVCATRKKVMTITRVVLTTLTAVAGGATVWLYLHRTTFDEPLFFILEFIVNLPLIISFFVFFALLSFTIHWWIKR
jgi:hypothetical protein